MKRPRVRCCVPIAFLLLTSFLCSASPAGVSKFVRLADQIQPFLDCWNGAARTFEIQATVDLTETVGESPVRIVLRRTGAESFELEVKNKDVWVQLLRHAKTTELVLPYHKVVFQGEGNVAGNDQLAPEQIFARLVSSGSLVSSYLPILNQSNATTIEFALVNLLKLKYQPDEAAWHGEGGWSFHIRNGAARHVIEAKWETGSVRITLNPDATFEKTSNQREGFRVVKLERAELERQLARGSRRALEILAPSSLLTAPEQTPRTTKNGELRWIGGQRVALLHGTPEEIGQAHAELLRPEAERCIDSVLYTFGTFQTIRTGHWFRHDIEKAYARLEPNISADYKAEIQTMAVGLGIRPELVQAVNVFPELFHCSGFAVFGSATKDGKLYHGRVLDYMTAIGLQDAAVTFVVAPHGKIPFANVGYAGFIGSVSGMNARAISLGEMGGGGEGEWDGVPMAMLMRQALEECATLDEVKALWTKSPRTCEYYYVFADGKTNRAVGVAATPKSIEFIRPGQTHPRLGEGIPDAVVLSAGSRLQTLRQRIRERYGKIDATVGQWLMSRPVAMTSNLHDVLFVPQDQIFFVAQADHRHPAAECPYVRFDLRQLLRSLPVDHTNLRVGMAEE